MMTDSEIKIVCIGQPKTGTTSINKLLRQLGLKTVRNPLVVDPMTSQLCLDNDTMFDMLHDCVEDLSGICESFQGFTDTVDAIIEFIFNFIYSRPDVVSSYLV